MYDGDLALNHAQVPTGRDVSQAHERVPVHEAAVPTRAQELETPERARMTAHGAGLVEDAVRVFAHAWLRQREALVHVAVKQTQHLAAEHEAGVLRARIARRYRQQRPQGLLKRRVHSMNNAVHRINVLSNHIKFIN